MSTVGKKEKWANQLGPSVGGKPYLALYCLSHRSSFEVLFSFWVKYDESPIETARRKISLISPEKALKFHEMNGFMTWEVKSYDCNN